MSQKYADAVDNSKDQAGVDLGTILYSKFGDGHVSPWLVIPAACLSMISIVGFTLNGSVVYVTITSKNLRGTCNFLLAFTCACEILHQCSHFPFLVVALFGGNFIDFYTCIKIQLVPLFGVLSVQISLTGIAMDRLVSVIAPIFYKHMNQNFALKTKYLSVFTAVISGFGLFSVWFWYSHGAEYKGNFVVCDIADALDQNELYTFFMTTSIVCNIISLLLYVALWLTVRFHSRAGDIQGKLTKSVLTIICINIGGYAINGLLMLVYITTLSSKFDVFWVLFSFNGFMLNVCAALNAPILYWTSGDYRRAFKNGFTFLLGKPDPRLFIHSSNKKRVEL